MSRQIYAHETREEIKSGYDLDYTGMILFSEGPYKHPVVWKSGIGYKLRHKQNTEELYFERINLSYGLNTDRIIDTRDNTTLLLHGNKVYLETNNLSRQPLSDVIDVCFLGEHILMIDTDHQLQISTSKNPRKRLPLPTDEVKKIIYRGEDFVYCLLSDNHVIKLHLGCNTFFFSEYDLDTSEIRIDGFNINLYLVKTRMINVSKIISTIDDYDPYTKEPYSGIIPVLTVKGCLTDEKQGVILSDVKDCIKTEILLKPRPLECYISERDDGIWYKFIDSYEEQFLKIPSSEGFTLCRS